MLILMKTIDSVNDGVRRDLVRRMKSTPLVSDHADYNTWD